MTIYIKSRRNEVSIESAYADSRNYLKIEFLFPFLFLFFDKYDNLFTNGTRPSIN